MTISQVPVPRSEPVEVTEDSLLLNGVTILHAEAVAISRRHLTEHGPEGLLDLVRRALPVGLLALAAGAAAADTGAIQRTLDDFARNVDHRSTNALAQLEATLDRLRLGEQAVARAAQEALTSLPSELERVLSGEAATVRNAVTEAARAVQDTGTREVRAALTQHAESVRNALSLDREGPVQTLRQDLLAELGRTRQELAEQLAVVRGQLAASEASQRASSKNSRAIGADWEAHVMSLVSDICGSAGDQFESVGSQRGVNGTTRRTGDGVSTLSPAITGHGRTPIRLVIEAKKRSRPLSQTALRTEAATAREVRDAAGCLVLVPTCAEVPGGGRFARLDDLTFAVSADEPETVTVVYLLLRELVALVAARRDGSDGVDITKLEAQLRHALTVLAEFDEVGRLAGAARKNLENLSVAGARVQKKLHDALTKGLASLHP